MRKHHHQGVSFYTKVTKSIKVRSTFIYIYIYIYIYIDIANHHKIKTSYNIIQQAGYNSYSLSELHLVCNIHQMQVVALCTINV
jgi:hypothetical protein